MRWAVALGALVLLASCAGDAEMRIPGIPPNCGDGFINSDEDCDDGNTIGNDACTNICALARCGDGILRQDLDATDDDAEQCDDGNRDNADACRNDCSPARCGDGVIAKEIEGCDDGNTEPADACTDACQTAHCGDGIARQDLSFGQPGYEACDDGNAVDNDACLSACERARCGDGVIRTDLPEGLAGYEACDDANDADADACRNTCIRSRCGDGVLRMDLGAQQDGYEACDDGNVFDEDACTNACTVARCGDGIARNDRPLGSADYEACDDGNAADTDGCKEGCRVANCGDGVWRQDLQEGEVDFEGCDDANDEDGDACLNNCVLARCGDGVLRADLAENDPAFEHCDDGNDWNFDGCADCSVPERRVYATHALGERTYAQLSDGSTWSWADTAPSRVDWPALRHLSRTAMVLVDGRVASWAGNEQQTMVPGFTEGLRAASGSHHNCAVVRSGRIFCWGANDHGQLGNGWVGENHNQDGPVAVQNMLNAIDVVASNTTSCALRSNHTVSCWGALPDRMLSLTSNERSSQLLASGNPITIEGANEINKLFLTTAWAQDGSDPACLNERVDPPLQGDNRCPEAAQLAGKACVESSCRTLTMAACAIDQGAMLKCWGDSVSQHDAITNLSGGLDYGCMVTTEGAVHCHGSNEEGQLGLGVRGEAEPGAVVDLEPVTSVVSSPLHRCALTRRGQVWCWGADGHLGQQPTEHYCTYRQGDPRDERHCQRHYFASRPMQVPLTP
ncbi:MAG: DUF4215 domain-containing protein [Myxococcota bacterium]|nr:DUF4215 domain-containing protein [Myxococcota bacterium]